MEKPIKEALGLGVDFKLKSGSVIKLHPATLDRLEDAMELYSKFEKARKTIQGLYTPTDDPVVKEARVAFEDLLLLANGQDTEFESEEQRKAAVKAVQKQFNLGYDVTDLYEYIHRFLGNIPADTGVVQEAEQQD